MAKLMLYRVDQPKKPTTYQIAYDPGMAKGMHLAETYSHPTGRFACEAYEKLAVRPATEEETKAYIKTLVKKGLKNEQAKI